MVDQVYPRNDGVYTLQHQGFNQLALSTDPPPPYSQTIVPKTSSKIANSTAIKVPFFKSKLTFGIFIAVIGILSLAIVIAIIVVVLYATSEIIQNKILFMS